MSIPMTQHRPSMSSGSIGRKRVGSVSQRGHEMSLPPLDIQSIQMPSNPVASIDPSQNALALKTAALASTKSLYQTCSALRKRLRCVDGFGPFLEQPTHGEPLDVVSQMCHIFRLGSPLCHLYNLLIPTFTDADSPLYAPLPAPKQIEFEMPNLQDSPDGVRNWAKRPDNAKQCQKYIAVFCMAMKQRQSEGRWDWEMWALHELWGRSSEDAVEEYDSTGLMKVLQTVEAILDCLPESAMSPISPSTPFTSMSRHVSRQSYDIPFSLGGMGPGMTAVSSMAATMNGGVHINAESPPGGEDMHRGSSRSSADANAFKSVEELVASEKSYVQELEILVRYSTELVECQLVSTESCHNIFSNLSKILDFHRKFLIKLETEYEPIEESTGPNAWAEGRWGRPFVSSELEFDCYGPYCANYLEAIKAVNEQMPNLLRGQELPEGQRPCLHPERELQAFMIKPIQRITKYGLLLDAILHATAKHDYAYRSELQEGLAAVKRIAAGINEVTDFKAKQATVRELIERVEDWKSHEVDKFGDLWLDDHFTVTKGHDPREYHVFLFEKMLLCCKEVEPERTKKGSKNSSMLRKDKTASKSSMPEKKKLALKGRIFLSNISRASISEKDGIPRMTVAWIVPRRLPNGQVDDLEECFVMTGKSEDVYKKWSEKIRELVLVAKRVQEEERALRRANADRYSSGNRYYDQSTFAPPTPATEQPPWIFPPAAPHDEYEESQVSGMMSGRSTPSMGTSGTYMSQSYGQPSGRRVQSQQATPADRHAELRARAMTEDQFGPSMTQWRSQQPPPLPRLTSAMSAMSTASEASFGTAPRPVRQMSQSRLGRAEEIDEESLIASSSYNRYVPSPAPRGMVRAPSHGVGPTVPHPPPLRSRSTSSPNVYQIPHISAPLPPIPVSAWADSPAAGASSSANLVGGTAYFAKRMSGSNKRSSTESHSTETSETSSQSPATPYDYHPIPASRQNSQEAGTMLIKVRCGHDQFVVSVNDSIRFDAFYERIVKKISNCRGESKADIQVKWIDADNDEVTLRCDADLEAMWEECKEMGINRVSVVAR